MFERAVSKHFSLNYGCKDRKIVRSMGLVLGRGPFDIAGAWKSPFDGVGDSERFAWRKVVPKWSVR